MQKSITLITRTRQIMEKFESEFKNAYYALLDASSIVCSSGDKDDDTCFEVWSQYKYKIGCVHELCRIARILGYSREDIDGWKREVCEKHNSKFKKENIKLILDKYKIV